MMQEDRHRLLEAEAARRGLPVAALVREALDAAYPTTAEEHRAAGRRVLGADPMPVPDVEDLGEELAAVRARRR